MIHHGSHAVIATLYASKGNTMKTSDQDIISLVNEITVSAQKILGHQSISVYLMGSLARGGFSQMASDIDIGIILSGVLQDDTASTIEAIQSGVVKNYPQIKNNVSIFWGNIDSINGIADNGRYPPFDRLDLIDHGMLLAGVEVRDKLIRPTQEALEIASVEFAIDYLANAERNAEFLDCQRITNKGVVYVTKTILFPARFIYLAKTGKIAGNDVSYHYYIDHFSGDDAKLVESAYQWRLHSLPDNQALVTQTMDKGLTKLYHHFISIYVERMDLYGQTDLKAKLLQWKKNITKPSI